jgi:hypothetical protein
VKYPFLLWGQPLRQIDCAELDGRAVVIATSGPPGREVRVYDSADGAVVAEYSVGSSMRFDVFQRPLRVVRRLGESVLAVGINHDRTPLPDLGSFFVRLLEPRTGEPAGPSLPVPARVSCIHCYSTSERDIVVVVDETGMISQFDPATGQITSNRIGLPGGMAESDVVLVPGTGLPLAVTGNKEGVLTAWDLASGEALWTDQGPKWTFEVALGCYGGRTYVAAVRGNFCIDIRDALTGALVSQLVPADPDDTVHLAFVPSDTGLLLYVGCGERLDCFDAIAGEPVRETVPWPDEISVIKSATIDGRDVLFVADDVVMCKLDARTGEILVGWAERTPDGGGLFYGPGGTVERR